MATEVDEIENDDWLAIFANEDDMVNDPDFQLPPEEVAEVSDSNYEVDTKISLQEVYELIMEAECPLTEIKKNFGIPPQPDEKKEKFNYRVLGRKNKKVANVGNFRPIAPGCPQLISRLFAKTSQSTPTGFTPKQIIQFREQIKVYFQLLVQLLSLAITNNKPFEVPSLMRLMVDLHQFNKREASDVGVDTSQLPQPDPIGREVYVPPDIASEEKNMANLFPCAGLELDPNQILARLQAIGLEVPSVRDAYTKTFIDSFAKIFREAYAVKPTSPSKKSGSELFTPLEDRLLLIGLQNYGPKNFGLIQEKLFPTLTQMQLVNRFKNRILHKAQDNIIKRFWLRQHMPLNDSEVKLFAAGIQKYGEDHNFEVISSEFLPERPGWALEEMFNDCAIRKVIKEESQLLDSQNHVIVQSSGAASVVPILLPGGGVYPAPSGGAGAGHSLAHLQFFQLPEAYLGSSTGNSAINSNGTKIASIGSAAIEASNHNNHIAIPKSNHPQTLERSVFQEFWENLKTQQGGVNGQQQPIATTTQPVNIQTQPPPIVARVGPRGEMDEDDGELKSLHRKTDRGNQRLGNFSSPQFYSQNFMNYCPPTEDPSRSISVSERERAQKPLSKKQRKLKLKSERGATNMMHEPSVQHVPIANDSAQTAKMSRAAEILLRQAQQNEFLIQYYSSSLTPNNTNGANNSSGVSASNGMGQQQWNSAAANSIGSQDRQQLTQSSNLIYDDGLGAMNSRGTHLYSHFNAGENGGGELANSPPYQIKLYPPSEERNGREEGLTLGDDNSAAFNNKQQHSFMMTRGGAMNARATHLLGANQQNGEAMQVEEDRSEETVAGNQFVNDIFLPKSPEKKKRKRRASLSQADGGSDGQSGTLSRIQNASGTNILGLPQTQRSNSHAARGPFPDAFSLNQASNSVPQSSWPNYAKTDHQYYLPRQNTSIQSHTNYPQPKPNILINNGGNTLSVNNNGNYAPPLKSSLDDILNSNRSTLKSPFDDLLNQQRSSLLDGSGSAMNIMQSATPNGMASSSATSEMGSSGHPPKKNAPKISLLHKRAALNGNPENANNNSNNNGKMSNRNSKSGKSSKNNKANNANNRGANTTDVEGNFDYLVVNDGDNSNAMATNNHATANLTSNTATHHYHNNNASHSNSQSSLGSQPIPDLLTASADSWRRNSGEAWRRNSGDGSPNLAASFEWKRSAHEWKEEGGALFSSDHLQWRSASHGHGLSEGGARAPLVSLGGLDGLDAMQASGDETAWRKRGSDEWRRCSLQDPFQSGQDPFGMDWKRRRNESGTWKRHSLSDGADSFFL